MQFIVVNEISEWLQSREVDTGEDTWQPRIPELKHRYRTRFAHGVKSGKAQYLASQAISTSLEWSEAVLWIAAWGIWASSEDWPQYYALRGSNGERRSLDDAPGHIFQRREYSLLISFLTLTLENAWDAHVFFSTSAKQLGTIIRTSHDEWIELQTQEPLSNDPFAA